ATGSSSPTQIPRSHKIRATLRRTRSGVRNRHPPARSVSLRLPPHSPASAGLSWRLSDGNSHTAPAWGRRGQAPRENLSIVPRKRRAVSTGGPSAPTNESSCQLPVASCRSGLGGGGLVPGRPHPEASSVGQDRLWCDVARLAAPINGQRFSPISGCKWLIRLNRELETGIGCHRRGVGDRRGGNGVKPGHGKPPEGVGGDCGQARSANGLTKLWHAMKITGRFSPRQMSANLGTEAGFASADGSGRRL